MQPDTFYRLYKLLALPLLATALMAWGIIRSRQHVVLIVIAILLSTLSWIEAVIVGFLLVMRGWPIPT
jgi:hypothetical protein